MIGRSWCTARIRAVHPDLHIIAASQGGIAHAGRSRRTTRIVIATGKASLDILPQSLYVFAVEVLQQAGPGHSTAKVGLAGGLAFVAEGKKASKFDSQSLQNGRCFRNGASWSSCAPAPRGLSPPRLHPLCHYEEILEVLLPKRDSEDLDLKVLLWGFQHDSSYACLRLLGLGAQLRFRQCGEHVSKQALPRAGAFEAFSYSAAASKFIFVVRSAITATGNPTATANLAKALEFSRPASLQATARSEHVPGASWCARPGHGCRAVEVGQKCRKNVYETAARV